ncbi:MAG: nucleotidyltransferase domain-containing protein [Nitrospira sp.]|nr:nucleotidyltransferase domain-containing protein [Nitrospira sp.]MCY3954926.1 nucleotidyltransferase domain-containing protein [Nitrospira sp.]
MTTPYEHSLEYSKCQLSKIRDRLKELSLDNAALLVCCGSYARGEASEQSDIDYVMVSDDTETAPDLNERVRSEIRSIVPNSPSEGGAFGATVNRSEILANIGGDDDSNKNITRRILLLLEGEWLFNKEGLRSFRREILERYIGEGMTDHQLALFLLNDIIRYYRTVAVDYEFKTSGSGEPKPWAIRNIKLVFSRKLLYASGLFSIAMTADRARDEKIEILEGLFDRPVMERMIKICGKAAMEPVLTSYNFFLEKLEDLETRKHLEKLEIGNRDDRTFRAIKNKGHHFTRELLKVFESTFDSTHPIHRAVIF